MTKLSKAVFSLIHIIALSACQATSNDRHPTALNDRVNTIEVTQNESSTTQGSNATSNSNLSSNPSSESRPTSSESSPTSSEPTPIAVASEPSSDTKASTPTTDSELESGTGVNNGAGPMGRAVHCQGKTEKSEEFNFTIQYTAVPTYIQGTLGQGERYLTMRCERVDADQAEVVHPDQQTQLWNCREIRNDVYDIDGIYRASIHTQGLSAIVVGEVTIDQPHPLAPKLFGSMVCK